MTPRGLDWAPVLGGSAVGAAVLAGCVAFSGAQPPYGYVRLALIALVVAAAHVVDEPAAAAVDASPLTLRRRTLVRSTAATVPLAVWAAGIAGLELRTPVTSMSALLVEGLGVLTVAVAAAAAARAARRCEPGELVSAGLGGALLAVLILDPAPGSVPLFPTGGAWAASTAPWAGLVVTAAAVMVAATREPYRIPRP